MTTEAVPFLLGNSSRFVATGSGANSFLLPNKAFLLESVIESRGGGRGSSHETVCKTSKVSALFVYRVICIRSDS